MSERSLATFLHNLLNGSPRPVSAVRDPLLLQQLIAQPSAALAQLLSAHIDAFLAELPSGAGLRPVEITGRALWVGAVLNNLAFGGTDTDRRPLTLSLRLSESLPPANTPGEAIAYHSLLRHLVLFTPGKEWQPIMHNLLDRSPLTALWRPYIRDKMDWGLGLYLLGLSPLSALVRDRLLDLLPPPEAFAKGRISSDIAQANAEVGTLLNALLREGGAGWRPFVLELYEADCERQRRGGDEKPSWPLLSLLRWSQRYGDSLQRRYAKNLVKRYSPLRGLLKDSRPYARLDGRFLIEVDQLLAMQVNIERTRRS